jgi:hypothetical protein
VLVEKDIKFRDFFIFWRPYLYYKRAKELKITSHPNISTHLSSCPLDFIKIRSNASKISIAIWQADPAGKLVNVYACFSLLGFQRQFIFHREFCSRPPVPFALILGLSRVARTIGAARRLRLSVGRRIFFVRKKGTGPQERNRNRTGAHYITHDHADSGTC